MTEQANEMAYECSSRVNVRMQVLIETAGYRGGQGSGGSRWEGGPQGLKGGEAERTRLL